MLEIVRGNPSEIKLPARDGLAAEEVESSVKEILRQVREKGDEAVFAYTSRFDGAELDAGNFRVTEDEFKEAYQEIDEGFLIALRLAVSNIEGFHRRQLSQSWVEPDSTGTVLGQIYRPLEKVGIYVPGGTAAYPSSVLMSALPARVAGVKRVVMVTPPGPGGKVNPYTLVAAGETGVKEIYKVGGAQAVAALAYGTESVPRVDKITGPGNIYVTIAKKMVYGTVDIDMIAGPSEVLVVADETAEPAWVVADLLSQAEHDPLAAVVLVTTSFELAEEVNRELEKQVPLLSRKKIVVDSLERYGTAVVVDDLASALEVANRFAPEHLELMIKDPWRWLGSVQNAGAVFLGHYSPEPVGDYLAGPNHVLPTGGTARFYSVLNVDTFMKKISVINYSQERFQKEAGAVVKLAKTEGLDAHARAVTIRGVGGE